MRFRFERSELIDLLPQHPPFLFLDAAAIEDDVAQASYRITGEEAPGHFAGKPVFPASLMMEALGQLACAWLLQHIERERGAGIRCRTQLFFVGAERIKCRRVCIPGDVLRLTVQRQKVREPLAYFQGRIDVGDEKTAVCESLTLSFGEIE